jgi:hypothetical protein
LTKARWQSGHAAACKAAYSGSIPLLASISAKPVFSTVGALRCNFTSTVGALRRDFTSTVGALRRDFTSTIGALRRDR